MILHAKALNKSGHNTFSNYYYFELSDFLPVTLEAFSQVGLCGLVSFTPETATLRIIDTESGGEILFTSPMSEVNLKGCHPVQNLGAVQTYQRRYLWGTAMEVIEGDPVDSSAAQRDEPTKPTPKSPTLKEPVKPTPKPALAKRETPRQVAPPEAMSESVPWIGEVLKVDAHSSPPGTKQPWTYYDIVFTDGKIARTFSETLSGQARELIGGPPAQATVTPGRIENSWKLTAIEAVDIGDNDFIEDNQ